MKKKLLLAGISVLLVVVMVATIMLGVAKQAGWEFPDIGNHFTSSLRKFMLNVFATEGGTLNRQGGEVEEGTLVELKATPNEGYMFAGWYSDKDVFLSTSSTYSLNMSKDTTLYARFCLQPENMSASATVQDNLRNCSEDFSFTVTCDRDDAEAYLLENLKIVDSYFADTEYEDLTAQDFDLTDLGDGEFLVTLKDDKSYEKGTTYTAVLPSTTSVEKNEYGEEEEVQVPVDASFNALGKETASLDFTIDYEEKSVVQPKQGIVNILNDGSTDDLLVEIMDDGLVEGEEGDVADALILQDSLSLNVGDIFCVYDGTVDENGVPVLKESTLYGKVLSIEEAEGTWRVTYGMPDLSEIFSDLDYAYSGDIDLEKEGVTIDEDSVVEQIRAILYQDETFLDSVAQIEAAATIVAGQYGYDVELISKSKFVDMLDIKISPKIKGTKASIDVQISLNVPITKKGKQLAQFSIVFQNKYEITFNAYANLKLTYWWFIPTGISNLDAGVVNNTKNTSSIGISLSYDRGSAGLLDMERNMKQEFYNLIFGGNLKQNMFYEKAKDLLKQGGYHDGTKLACKLAEFRVYLGIFSFNITAEMRLTFDIAGSFLITNTSQNYLNIGVCKTARGMQLYENKSASCSASNLMITGSVGVRAGVHANIYVSIAGLSKYIQLGLTAGAGVFVRVEGFASFAHGVYGGNLRAGAYATFAAYYKVFSMSGNFYEVDKEWTLFQFGYKDAIISYVNQSALLSDDMPELAFTQNGFKLLDAYLLKVYRLDTSNGEMTAQSLEPKSKDYNLKVVLGKNTNLTYDANTGKLSAKSGAPLYFEERVTIEVTGKGYWTTLNGSSVTCYVRLPSVTITIVYGDEDAYYASIDSETEAAYRALFRNYNSHNDSVLKKEFNQLITKAFTVGDAYKPLYTSMVNIYMDNLFAHIKTQKAKEDNNRTKENAFVSKEPAAFENTILVLNSIIKDKTFNENELALALDATLQSTVMYDSIIALSKLDHIDELTARFDSFSETTKSMMAKSIIDFESRYVGNTTAAALANAFRVILRVEE